jgi:hypothetical protein
MVRLHSIFTILLISFMFTVASADQNILVGKYGHAYTAQENTPVWAIQEKKGKFTIYQYGDNSHQSASIATEQQKQSFWDKMFWEPTTSLNAMCIMNKESIICHFTDEERKQIPDIASYQSNYFYYDTLLGLMEIKMLKTKNE